MVPAGDPFSLSTTHILNMKSPWVACHFNLYRTSELVDCMTFESAGETQPFEVTVSSNVLLLVVSVS